MQIVGLVLISLYVGHLDIMKHILALLAFLFPFTLAATTACKTKAGSETNQTAPDWWYQRCWISGAIGHTALLRQFVSVCKFQASSRTSPVSVPAVCPS